MPSLRLSSHELTKWLSVPYRVVGVAIFTELHVLGGSGPSLHGDPGSLQVAELRTQPLLLVAGGSCSSAAGAPVSQRSLWRPPWLWLASLSSLGPETSVSTRLKSKTGAGHHAPLRITSAPGSEIWDSSQASPARCLSRCPSCPETPGCTQRLPHCFILT